MVNNSNIKARFGGLLFFFRYHHTINSNYFMTIGVLKNCYYFMKGLDDMKSIKGIKVCIEPERVREYYESEKERLSETMDIVAKSEYDDSDKACCLFVTNEDGKMFLSLESPDAIVDSWINPTVEEIKSAIMRLSEISTDISA